MEDIEPKRPKSPLYPRMHACIEGCNWMLGVLTTPTLYSLSEQDETEDQILASHLARELSVANHVPYDMNVKIDYHVPLEFPYAHAIEMALHYHEDRYHLGLLARNFTQYETEDDRDEKSACERLEDGLAKAMKHGIEVVCDPPRKKRG